MNTRTLVLLGSVLLFVASLTQDAYYLAGDNPDSWSASWVLLLMVWMGVFYGVITWLANPPAGAVLGAVPEGRASRRLDRQRRGRGGRPELFAPLDHCGQRSPDLRGGDRIWSGLLAVAGEHADHGRRHFASISRLPVRIGAFARARPLSDVA